MKIQIQRDDFPMSYYNDVRVGPQILGFFISLFSFPLCLFLLVRILLGYVAVTT